MSPLLVMDDVCRVGASLAVPPRCSSKNESSLVLREREKQKANMLFLCDKLSVVLTGSPLGPIIPG